MKYEISPKSTETELNWYDAVLYCQFLECDGFGWRLPTKDELNKIYNSKNDFEKRCYWAGTEFNNLYAWHQYFSNGAQYYDGYKNGNSQVRAIRDL